MDVVSKENLLSSESGYEQWKGTHILVGSPICLTPGEKKMVRLEKEKNLRGENGSGFDQNSDDKWNHQTME